MNFKTLLKLPTIDQEAEFLKLSEEEQKGIFGEWQNSNAMLAKFYNNVLRKNMKNGIIHPRNDDGIERLKNEHKSWTDIRRSLMFKYKSLGKAAKALGVTYICLSNVIHGQLYTVYVIEALQKDLNLTDDQVLTFWPLLGKWPKPSKRREHEERRRNEG